jgi:transcription elongation GreA/GreB family factor
LDGADFETRPLDEALVRFEKLLSFQKDARVLNPTWGLGKVVRLDYFYRRITVDFRTRKGHQFTYAAAIDMLERAPDNHILVLREADPARVEAMLKEQPGEFVKAVLKSYGDLPLVKLEDICVANGFIKAVNWKKFWESARADLRRDKLVTIPAKRTEPLQLREAAEDYGDVWLTNFCHETDPKLILAAVREYVAQGRFAAADEAVKARLGERLAFAVVAARNGDDALYARLACQLSSMGFARPAAEEMRAYLWERRRFIRAAADLPAREVGAMLTFLAVDDAAKEKLYAHLDELCFTAVLEIVSMFGDEPACRAAVGALMRLPKAPATLTTLLVGKDEVGKSGRFSEWAELPPLTTLLTHAIALGEGRQSGEQLKMQNMIRRLFADTKWLEKMFGRLDESGQVMFFERFQASFAWDPSTHHTIVVRMTRIVPALEKHLVRAEKKKEYARLTSYRSFALRKAEYLKLINEEMPANVKRIEEAKSYGDLSENAEYQYAKDEQRALMQKQALMQEELEAVKPGDFADASVEEVMPGVTVIVAAPEGERVYHVLGEWDNDVERGILSSKTRVAQNMLGKKTGDEFELPGAEGTAQFARIVQIKPLSEEIREWMKLPDGLQI